MRYLYNCLIVLSVFISATYVQAQTLAFPGAEGFGRFAKGGRGGRVIEVTNLNDSGPGSLREALEASGPRTVVFRVGGTIALNNRIIVTNGFLTVAGHTAPGDGILVKSADIVIRASDVIIRYLRVRTGISNLNPLVSDAIGVSAVNSAATPVMNVVLDHVSLSWAEDEVFSVWTAASNVTIQWSTIGESLNPPKSSGILIGGSSTNVSIHHNLIIGNWDRSPLIKRGNVDVVNNVIYNYGDGISAVWPKDGIIRANWVGNHYLEGPLSPTFAPLRLIGELYPSGTPFITGTSVYLSGNRHQVHRPNDTLPEDVIVRYTNGPPFPALTGTRHNHPLVTTTNAELVKDQVLDNAGANKVAKSDGTFRTFRDAVDERYFNEVNTLTGVAINAGLNNPDQVGGYPTINGGTPPLDADHDGMPDSWESAYGFNPNNAADGPQDADGDGYTNLEEYLHSVVPGASTVPKPPGDLRVDSS